MRSRLITSLLLLASALSSAASDTITLKNKDQFFGRVVALKDGLIELDTPLSDTPLKVLNKDLLRLNFADDQKNADHLPLPKDPQNLLLRNGDSFPGKLVTLTETHLGFETWFAGTLDIPRHYIDTITFGVTPQSLVYQGPRNIDGWTQQPDNPWTFRDNTLRSRANGFIGKNIPLPTNFIFNATVSWATSPNLRIHLCTDRNEPVSEKIGDGYLIFVNSSGIQVSRSNSDDSSKSKYNTLITHTTRLRDLASKQIQLELRVDRETKKIQLYLDGRKLESGIDLSDPPSGTSILFESLSSTEGNAVIKNINVQEWDTVTERIIREPRAAADTDTISVDDGDRFSGKIIGFDASLPTHPFTVTTPLSPDPIQIPSKHCSAMYLAKGEDPPESKGQYQLDLRPGGNLTLSGIQLGKDKLTATHPWLGELKIDRRIMSSISKGN